MIGLAIIPIAHATTVGFSPAPTARTVTNASGITLSTSSLVLVGNFSIETFSFNSSVSMLTNFGVIAAAGGWEQFTLDTGTATTNAGATSAYSIDGTGKLGGSGTDNTVGGTKADFFNGKSIYVWIFNGSTIAASTEMGIFKATTASPSWLFPTNGAGLGDSVVLSTTTGGASALVPVSGVGNVTSTQIRLVPEPSSVVLVVTGVMGLLAHRRRVSRTS